MARLGLYLCMSMLMSMFWGIFVLLIGTSLRFSIEQLVSSYVSDLESSTMLSGSVNRAGQNMCPVELEPNNNVFLGNWADFMGSIVIITGVVIMFYSTMGFMAGLVRSKIFVALELVLILLAFGFEICIFRASVTLNDSFHVSAEEELIGRIQTGYEISNEYNLFAKVMNAIMLTGECCGIRGPRDFHNMTFIDQDLGGQKLTFLVSVACCKKELFTSTAALEAFDELRACAMEGYYAPQNLNMEGCYKKVYHHVFNSYGTLVTVGLAVLSLWQLFQIILSTMMIFAPKHKWMAPKLKFYRGPTHHHKHKHAKFRPYWAVSGARRGDVDRRPSTEIW